MKLLSVLLIVALDFHLLMLFRISQKSFHLSVAALLLAFLILSTGLCSKCKPLFLMKMVFSFVLLSNQLYSAVDYLALS